MMAVQGCIDNGYGNGKAESIQGENESKDICRQRILSANPDHNTKQEVMV